MAITFGRGGEDEEDEQKKKAKKEGSLTDDWVQCRPEVEEIVRGSSLISKRHYFSNEEVDIVSCV